MENNWFISVNGQVYGPYQAFAISQMLEKGEILVETYVYHSSIGKWTPAFEVKFLWKEKKKKKHKKQKTKTKQSHENARETRQTAAHRQSLPF